MIACFILPPFSYQAEFMNLEMSPDFNFLQSRLPISGKGSKGERNHRIDDAINNNVIRNDEKNSPGTFGEQISDIFDGETLAGRVETEREEEEEGHRIRKRTNSRKEELSELAKEEGRNEEEQIVKDEKKEQEESSDEEEEEEQEEETIVKSK